MAIIKSTIPAESYDEVSEWLRSAEWLDADTDDDTDIENDPEFIPGARRTLWTTEDIDGPGRGGD